MALRAILRPSSRTYVPDSKSVKPYSLSRAAFTGSATAASLLVLVDPETCQPANCGGRTEDSAGCRACVAAGVSPAKAAPKANTSTIRTDVNLVTIRQTGQRPV